MVKNKEKRKKSKTSDKEEVLADDTASEVSKKKKRKNREAELEEASPKKKKKKSSTPEPLEDAGAKQPKANDEPKKKKKEKRAKDLDLSDPAKDDSLSEQASKALSYAYLQFSQPATWKFNKARQNWLIRNIWSEKAIPEAHVPLVLKYLTGVKGGVREALIKSCQDIIQESSEPGPNTADPSPMKKVAFADEPGEKGVAEEDKRGNNEEPPASHRVPRATKLLRCLSMS